MTKRTLSYSELQDHLREQLGALMRSAQSFDEGYVSEARRMAVILRVLLHSGRNSSLLKLLDLEKILFFNTAMPFDPKNLASTHSLVSISMGPGNISYSAKLDDAKKCRHTPFQEWWSEVVFADKNKVNLSRSTIVRTAADQDGGAHVDAALQGDYAALRYDNTLGWMTNLGGPPTGDPVYTSIRQIAHEVLKTLVPGYRKSRDDVRAAQKESGISGGKMRFYPHESKFFMNELTKTLEPGKRYLTELVVDSITTGRVFVVVNTKATSPIITTGQNTEVVEAGSEERSGVFGEYTDAVIDRVSIRELAT